MRLEAKQPTAGKVFKKVLRLPGNSHSAYGGHRALGMYPHAIESAVRAFQCVYSEFR